jgi:hypothetical protein
MSVSQMADGRRLLEIMKTEIAQEANPSEGKQFLMYEWSTALHLFAFSNS